MTTRSTGSELPATLGGPGFVRRAQDHAQEVEAGRLWRRCGARSEVAPLREVLLSWPSQTLLEVQQPEDWLMLARPDLATIRDQALAVVAAFEGLGVQVHLHRADNPPPNYLFMRDLVFLTPEGAVLGRPAGRVRAGEERFMAAALAELGVPISRTLRGSATFEGADALWIREDAVLVGVGQRTNAAGFAQVAAVLAEQGVQAEAVALPSATQHLLGVVMLVDADLAVVHGGRLTEGIRAALEGRGYRLLVMPPGEEVDLRRAMNLVTLGPRRVLMPAGCPASRGRLEAAGVETHEAEVGEYLKAGGALGCMTAILRRGAAQG